MTTIERRLRTADETEREIGRWCADVLAGRIVVGRLVRHAVQRHVADLSSGAERGLTFDAKAATRAVNFIEQLEHTTGEFDGQRFLLQPWQFFLVWCLFGWMRRDGLRRFREAYISLGRGNGKTPMAAALLLLLCCFDQPLEPR